MPGTCFGCPFWTAACHGICRWWIVSPAYGVGRRRSIVSSWNDDLTNCADKNYHIPVCLFHFGIRGIGVCDHGSGRRSRLLRLDVIWEAWDG